MASLQNFLAYVDDPKNQTNFKNRLRAAVGFQSVSSDPTRHQELKDMGTWLENRLRDYSVDTMQVDLNKIVRSVSTPELPNLVLGKIDGPPGNNLKTLLVHGHYDVQPAKPDDAWETENHNPFKLTQTPDGRMVGRGSTDDKGPIMGWINVLEAHHGSHLPVNLRFCFEGTEESGAGLNEYLATDHAKKYFAGVTDVCISDNYWLTTRTPAVTYGLRGIMYYRVTVNGPLKDLHSGVYGGMVYEPLAVLTKLLASLTSSDGTILVPGVNELVEPLDFPELRRYEDIRFTPEDVKNLRDKETGNILVTEEKTKLLMNRMRYPSLSLHGIFGGAEQESTIIPHEVFGEFSIRLVPNQTPGSMHGLVESYLTKQFDNLHTKCTMTITEIPGSAPPWLGDVDGPSFQAAKKAVEAVYGTPPDFTREGGTIEVALTFSKMDGVKDVVLLPMGRSDDGAHSVNEKLDEDNFFNGTKVLGTYLYKLAEIVNN